MSKKKLCPNCKTKLVTSTHNVWMCNTCEYEDYSEYDKDMYSLKGKGS